MIKGEFVIEGKKVGFELDDNIAPVTVNNFVNLVKKGFYDGLTFHRIIPGFMIQGGDPEGSGVGGPGYSIKGEFDANGFKNPLKHTEGILSMARSNDPNSAGSQFFIMVSKQPHLDGQYASFGKIVSNYEFIVELSKRPRNHRDYPLSDVKIDKVVIL
jgi:peptidyl-prolyl cis-trans isomerase B (cyclophilin B)